MANTQKKTTVKRYKQWMINQAIIQKAYADLIKEHSRCPTVLEVSKEVKLSITTINKHVKEMSFEAMIQPMRALTPDVLASIYRSAQKGSPAAQKLWLQVEEKWVETQEVRATVHIKVNTPDKKDKKAKK